MKHLVHLYSADVAVSTFHDLTPEAIRRYGTTEIRN